MLENLGEASLDRYAGPSPQLYGFNLPVSQSQEALDKNNQKVTFDVRPWDA